MEGHEVTEFIKKILGKSEALQYCKHFKGINNEKFKRYSFEDLKRTLPSTEEGELAAAEIKAQIDLAIMMIKVRAEKGAGGNVSSFFPPSKTGEQAGGMDESGTGADGISMETVIHNSTEIEVVTLDSDEEEDEPEDDPKSCESSDEDSSDSEYMSRSESSESDDSDADGPCPKRQRQTELASGTGSSSFWKLASGTGRPLSVTKAKIQPVLNLGSSRNSTHKFRVPTKKGRKNQRWYDEIHGHQLTTINAYQWSWKPLSNKRQNNLFRVLCNSPNLEKLNLFYDAVDKPADIELPEGSLLKLKKLLVCHRRNMNIGNLFRTILKVATNLKRFEYKFSIEAEEDLGLLGEFDWAELQCLSVFSLSSPSYLTKRQVENLLQVRAPKLRQLELGIGLYEDVSGDLLENVLKNFPTMQFLYIPGQYYSHTDAHPAVTINLPKLSQLKHLNLGGKYSYTAIATTNKNSKPSALKQAFPKAKPFHVTLKFNRILSKLKTLVVGSMYHIDRLHLICFPKLEVLCVASPWHLSSVFSEKKGRNYSYPLITGLQLPDGLSDASFVSKIPQRFPNVKKCYVYLPSALVLRTFFNAMKDTGLKELYLKIQFDFSSTLESCLMDKVLPVKKTSEDWKRVAKLEKCVNWKELVAQHNITLPLRNDEEVQVFVEATGEYGMEAMKQLDKFYLWHIPKTLSLTLEENNEAESTITVKLGYTKYPISIECCDVVRLTSKEFWWDLEEPEGERKRWKKAGQWASDEPFDEDLVEIDAVTAHKSNLKEVKDED